MFSVDERIEMLTEVTAEYGNVRVDSFHGLLVHYCQANDIPVIVKGIRAVSDFDYELKMAQMNHGLTGVETLFMPTNPEFSFLSSSLVKEVATWGGDVGRLVPAAVLERLVAGSTSGGEPTGECASPGRAWDRRHEERSEPVRRVRRAR